MSSGESPLIHCSREIKSVEEAHFAVLYGCMHADEEISHEENEKLMNLFYNSKMFKGLHLISSWDHMRRLMDKYGEETLISAAFKHLPDSLLGTLHQEVKEILLSDGTLTEREKNFLDKLENRINGKWN